MIRSGEAVARIVSISGGHLLGRDLIDRWQELPHLDPDDADDFAKCVDESRENLDSPTSQC